MMVLGLGSNIGDRLTNLRLALQAIKQIPNLIVHRVSPIYISDALLPEDAPPDWDQPYLNLALQCETTLEPTALLAQLKKIEWSIGRKPEKRHWGPRIIDIDILAWDDLVIQTDTLTVPHDSLQERPFALWPLADIAPEWPFPLPGKNHGKTAAQIVEEWGSRFSGEAPFHTKQINHRIDTPIIVGIVNVTPDSFSDGGKYLHAEVAAQHALDLVAAGAEVIDIGAESTAPRASLITPQEEWQRLEPVLAAIKAAKPRFLLPPKISVDTRHAEVARLALAYDIDWLNDVSGLQDPAMREIVAQSQKDCVIMHHVSLPASRDHVLPRNQDAVQIVYDWCAKQIDLLQQAGISPEKMIFDPGIGFGKTPEQSFALIQQAAVFKKLGTRVLIGHSRKSFLSLFTQRPFAERDIETLSLSLYLANQSIDYLRIHDVEMCTRALRVMRAVG